MVQGGAFGLPFEYYYHHVMDIVCFDVLYRTRTTLHVLTYDMDVQHRTLSTYYVAIYDIVRLTYDIVCNIQCHMLHI